MNTEFVFKVKKEMYRIIQNVSSVSFEYFIYLTSQIGLNASLFFWFSGIFMFELLSNDILEIMRAPVHY